MAEIGLAASIITVIDLAVKVGVLCSRYCADLKNARRDVRPILNEADRLAVTLRNVEQLLRGPNGAKIDASQNIRWAVADCRRQLDKLAVKLEEGTKYRNIKWPLKKEEVEEITKDLGRCQASISLDLHVHQSAVLVDVHQEVVLAKLRTVAGASFDSHAEANNARCHPSTRVDILKKIQSWAAACDGECIFWLNGKAGTGKSTISRTVAQSFNDKGMLGASFFFKRGEGDRGRAAFFVTTIAKELACRVPSFAPHLRDEVDDDPLIGEKQLKDQFDKLIVRSINKLPCQPQPPVIVIVVDALDECDNFEDTKLIIRLLSQARELTSIRLRFFVTSRPELPIRLGFNDINGKYKDLILDSVPEQVIEHDIAAFLRDELERVQQEYNRCVSPSRHLPCSWPGSESIQKLANMASPLFIFAATACRFIRDRRVGSPNDQLVRILEHKTSKSSMDATYLPVLNQLQAGLPRPEMDRVAERFRHVVGSIVTLASPLSVSSLARLLELSLDDIEDQLDFLHSVLNIPSDRTMPVQLLHLSFRDFLVDPEKGREQDKYPFWVNEKETHRRLAANCLQLLAKGGGLKRNICGLPGPGTFRSEINKQSIDVALSPEVQYACRYWVYHLKESRCHIRGGDPVDGFLTRHLLHWLEALSLLGQISEAVSMVDSLIRLLHPEDSRNLSAFLHDARRIILSHSSILDISPLQIYSSAIVFAPEQSIVRANFRSDLPRWLSQLPQVNSDWDACLRTLEGDSRWVTSMAFSHDSSVLASASDDQTVKLWDIATGTCMATLEGHSSRVNAVTFSHDSGVLASASNDETIKLWDIATGTCMATLEGHSSWVESVAFSHESSVLASGSEDETVKLWDIATCTCTATLEGHGETVTSVVFSHDSSVLASASHDKTIKLWDIPTGKCMATLEGHSGGVMSVAFLHDSSVLESVSDDGTAKIWDITMRTCTATLKVHDEKVHGEFFTSVAFSHDLSVLAWSHDGRTVKLWDIAKGTCMAKVQGYSRGITSITFSHDSSILAWASHDSTVKLWDTSTGTCRVIPEGHNSVVFSMVVSHDSNVLASASEDETVKLWDVATRRCTATLKGHRAPVTSVAFSHDSSVLASASWDGILKLWDVATGCCTATLERHWDSVGSVAFSHDSSVLASTSWDGTVKLWNTATGSCMATLEGHRDPVSAVAFSHDSSILASGSGDNTIKLWDVATCVCIATLEGQTDGVNSVAFSHDSKVLASASYGEAIKFWDLATGSCTATLDGGRCIDRLAFDATGSVLQTNIGTLMLDDSLFIPQPLSTSVSTNILPRQYSMRRGLGLTTDCVWLTWDSQRILWLPHAYRPVCVTVIGSMVAIGCVSGQVLFMAVKEGLMQSADMVITGS